MVSKQDSVILISDDSGNPDKVLIKDGSEIKWFKLTEMSYGDFAEYLQANNVQ